MDKQLPRERYTMEEERRVREAYWWLMRAGVTLDTPLDSDEQERIKRNKEKVLQEVLEES